ncbi:MAG TPA: site-2 protease family protein [Anaeromyxobacter sp.]|nr:site-2 protease family protein [Anaeromyxobacter sp.]
MQNSFVTLLVTIAVLGGLIFVHELGHYLVAKLLGVKVLRFSIGFGPPIFSFQRGDTEYRIAWVPLGGYVKMAGADPTEEVAPEDRGRSLLEQPPGRRLLISLAGPVMNLVLPLALFAGLFWSRNGDPVPAAIVGAVTPGSPAEAAGLRPDDRFVAVTGPDGERRVIRDFEDLVEKVAPHPGQPLAVEIERAGQLLPPITVRTTSDVQNDGLETVRQGKLGVIGDYLPAQVAPVAPGAAGPLQPFDLVVAAGGAPVKHERDLSRALAAAECRPIDLEVLRERPRKLPGVILADYTRERLAGVPTCVDGKPSFRLANPWVVAMIAAVEPGGPADRAGLRRGDVVTALNGKPVRNAPELERLVGEELASFQPGTLTLADGRTLPIVAEKVTVQHPVTKKERTLPTLRVHASGEWVVDRSALDVPTTPLQRGVAEILALSTKTTVGLVRGMMIGIQKLLTREIASSEVSSVIGIVRETGRAVERGLYGFIVFVALLSVNLGVMNLLPIPVLDGGNIVQAMVEVVTRRPLSLRMREIANMVGLFLIVSLMLLAFKNDIVKLFQPDPPRVEAIRR